MFRGCDKLKVQGRGYLESVQGGGGPKIDEIERTYFLNGLIDRDSSTLNQFSPKTSNGIELSSSC